jgi:hypothetical protein
VRIPISLLLIGIITLLLALFIGTQVLGVLYSILFPPGPPLPGESVVTLHTPSDYGVDEWVYASASPACDVVRFYQEQGGSCRVAPLWCGDQPTDDDSFSAAGSPRQNVAQCTGESRFSIFSQSWEVIIATGDNPQQTTFRLAREIFWSGQVPPNPESIFGEG